MIMDVIDELLYLCLIIFSTTKFMTSAASEKSKPKRSLHLMLRTGRTELEGELCYKDVPYIKIAMLSSFVLFVSQPYKNSIMGFTIPRLKM